MDWVKYILFFGWWPIFYGDLKTQRKNIVQGIKKHYTGHGLTLENVSHVKTEEIHLKDFL